MICIIAIGGLLVEYMNDGTIYNHAFNIIRKIVAVLYMLQFLHGLFDTFVFERPYPILVSLNSLSNMAMVFLFTYDSARHS